MSGQIGNVSYFANVSNSAFSPFIVINHMSGGLLALLFIVVLMIIVAYALNKRGYHPLDTAAVTCFFAIIPSLLFWSWTFDGISMINGWIPFTFGVLTAGFTALSRSINKR